MTNNNLHEAKKAKNDEFYTQLSDIENDKKFLIIGNMNAITNKG